MNKKLGYGLAMIVIGFCLGVTCLQINRKSNLDDHYFSCLKNVKERLIYGSEVDTKKSLEDYEDRIELYMHLDGYSGVDILRMKIKAITELGKEKRK